MNKSSLTKAFNRTVTCAVRSWAIYPSLLSLILSAASAQDVVTLAGGPTTGNPSSAGFRDGDSLQEAQFSAPLGVTVSGLTTLFVADKNNGAIRKLDLVTGRTTTVIRSLDQPVDVVVDSGNNLYVLDQGNGKILQYDRYGNFVTTIASGLNAATAMALDGSTNFYVTLLNGIVKQVSLAGSVINIASGFDQPQGVAVLNDGQIAVSDSGNHGIWLIQPVSHSVSLLAGGSGPGFADGPPPFAKLNAPQKLAAAPNGSLIVADRFNHRIRVVETNGLVTTVYGVDRSAWLPDFPGWEDGPTEIAAAREPSGVAVASDGTLFVTELYWNLVRKVTGLTLSSSGGAGGAGDNPNQEIIPPPTIAPNSGYFPNGNTITVTSPNPAIFYTTDGTEPTTNSMRLTLSGNVGTLRWQNPLHDLTFLRLKAFKGTNSSSTTVGLPSSINEIGIPRDVTAGVGSTVVVPVVLNLKPEVQLRSIQFRIEITPLTGGPAVSSQFRALTILSNDFVQVVRPSTGGADASFNVSPYQMGDTRGLVISAIGTNSSFSVQNYATAAMLAVPIPPSSAEGQQYQLSVLFPSATSDGLQNSIELHAMPDRTITIQNSSYVVGDSSPGFWYNTSDFGDQSLNNNDVNNAFYASLGVRRPYSFSDAFDAMDAFPLDSPGSVGGDGEIRFLDWQRILLRSLNLDTMNWSRSWSSTGVRTNQSMGLAMAQLSTANSRPRLASPSGSLDPASTPGCVWLRQATLSAQSLAGLIPGESYSLPVFVKVAPGYSLAGMSFRAVLENADDAPPLTQALEFVAAPGLSSPIQGTGSTLSELLCGWPLAPSPSFSPPLQGSNLLGWIQFQAPAQSTAGQHYVLRFKNADGSPDIETQYDLESVPATASIGAASAVTEDPISDEWKLRFFGDLEDKTAQAQVDADEDGVSNLEEFIAGTDPTNSISMLRLLGGRPAGEANTNGLTLRWLTAPGKKYVLETTSSLTSREWTVISSEILGDGTIRQLTPPDIGGSPAFYRIRVQP